VCFQSVVFFILEFEHLNLFRISDSDIRVLPESRQGVIFGRALVNTKSTLIQSSVPRNPFFVQEDQKFDELCGKMGYKG